MTSILQRNGTVFYYGNPAGTIRDNRAVMDSMFQSEELEHWLAGHGLSAEWTEGVYDRLVDGAPAMMDESAEPLKACRIWQISNSAPDTMRFASYKAMAANHGAPDLDCYDLAFDGQVGTNDLEAIYSKFSDNLAPGFSRTLAISDLIELYDSQGSSFYYVDKRVLQPCEPTQGAPAQEMGMGVVM